MDIGKSLNKKRAEIFTLLMKEPNLTVTDLAERFKISQPAMTKHLGILEKNKMVKIEFDDKGKGIKKRYSASFRGVFEDMANFYSIKFIDRVYESIDSTMNTKTMRERMLKNIPEKKISTEVLMMKLTMSFFDPNFLNDMKNEVEKDINLQKAFEDVKFYFAEIKKKLEKSW